MAWFGAVGFSSATSTVKSVNDLLVPHFLASAGHINAELIDGVGLKSVVHVLGMHCRNERGHFLSVV